MEDHPTPWEVRHNDNVGMFFLRDANRRVVADQSDGTAGTREAFLHMAKCVNMHEELVQALEKLVGECKEYDKWDRSATKNDLKRVYGEIDALLAKAKGEE